MWFVFHTLSQTLQCPCLCMLRYGSFAVKLNIKVFLHIHLSKVSIVAFSALFLPMFQVRGCAGTSQAAAGEHVFPTFCVNSLLSVFRTRMINKKNSNTKHI